MKMARSVVIVPGYGMAVAQAQHKVRELADALEKEGVEVRFAIHPVAGRMPGHMNVLLAEANVPYEQLLDMEEINGDFPQTDVVAGARRQRRREPGRPPRHGSPIYGMPILEVDKAATVFVVKRSMRAGFAGIENELFFNEQAPRWCSATPRPSSPSWRPRSAARGTRSRSRRRVDGGQPARARGGRIVGDHVPTTSEPAA